VKATARACGKDGDGDEQGCCQTCQRSQMRLDAQQRQQPQQHGYRRGGKHCREPPVAQWIVALRPVSRGPDWS